MAATIDLHFDPAERRDVHGQWTRGLAVALSLPGSHAVAVDRQRNQSVIAFGDPATADKVITYVPGVRGDATVGDEARRAVALRQAAQREGGGKVAAVLWQGYTPPPTMTAGLSKQDAVGASGRLATFQAQLRRANPAAHQTVVGHSYGSVVAGEAARTHGMRAGDLVLVGSPGTTARHAAELGPAGHVWAAANAEDPVARLAPVLSPDFHGSPVSRKFGARVFSAATPGASFPGAEHRAAHSSYLEPGSEALPNIGAIAAGRYDRVTKPTMHLTRPRGRAVDLAGGRVKTPAPQRSAGRRKLAAAGQALPDDSYPIPNVAYLKKAIRSVGRAPASKRPALAALIRKRAAELKATKAPGVKGTWAFQAANSGGRVLELVGHFDPSQPRDTHGKWAHTPSWKPEHAREAAVPAAQRASGIWGGRTAAEHQAEVGKLTPGQLSVYNRLQANGVSLPAALKYAKRGRMPAPPRPPAGMDTPNMRRAISYGLLGADNRLGGISRARSSSAMNYASTHGKVVDLAMAMTRRMPVVHGAADVQLSRTGPGKVTVMHKSTGAKIGTLTQAGRGWQGVHSSGAKTPASGTTGGAVAGLVAAHNQLARGKKLPPAQQDGTASYAHEAGDGIDLAGSLPHSTPASSASDGPRVTTAGGSGSGPGGLTGEAAAIYAKLIKKGLKPGQAAALARRAAAMHAKTADAKAA